MASSDSGTSAAPTRARGRQESTIARAVRALRRDRAAGYTAVGVVAVLVAAVVGLGGPVHNVLAKISNIGAWLSNDDKGSVTHANGLSGKADTRITLASAVGHPLKVTQDGDTVLVQDTVTGVVSRIDPPQLKVVQSVRYGSPGVQIVVGGGSAYVIDPAKGLVQLIDPDRLSAVGAPVSLSPPLGAAAVDPHGTLWVPVTSAGQLVPVTGGAVGAPVSVGSPHDELELTMAGGVPVVIDATSSTLTVVQSSGGRQTVNLPVTQGAGVAPLLAPATTDGALVPLLDSASHRMVLVDTNTGTPTSVSLDGANGDELGAPQALGQRIYIPDHTTGRLMVYDAGSGQMLNQVNVTGKRGKLDVFLHDGLLWANDADGATAVSVDSTGVVHVVSKYTPDLAGGPLPSVGQSPSAGPAGGGPVAGAGPQPGQQPGGGKGNTGNGTGGRPPAPKPSPSRSTPPASTPPALPPSAPSNVSETAQRGSILVKFSPSAGATPIGYALSGAPAGATVASTGQYQFTVSGLSCGPTYPFTVVAHYPNGDLSASGPGALACLVPKAPASVSLDTGTQHQITASWPATTDDGGASVTYSAAISGGSAANVGTATSHTFTNLTNFKNYTVTVTATNGAGNSTPPASHAGSPSAGPWTGNLYNNALFRVNVRSTKNADPSCANCVTNYPPGSTQQFTVKCIDPGGSWADPTGSPTGNTWYRVTSPVTGWVGSGYINVSGAWACDGQFGN
jgi:hypothetical protein